MAFELWEVRSGNLAADFATEAEALQVVRTAIAQHGPTYIDSFLLVEDRGEGQKPVRIAAGPELAQRALSIDVVARAGTVVSEITNARQQKRSTRRVRERS